jgi:hypothetical protein
MNASIATVSSLPVVSVDPTDGTVIWPVWIALWQLAKK